MNNLAVALKDAPFELREALVVSCEGARIVARTQSATFECARAVSCLVAPAPGDTVLVAVSESRSFITAVLCRPEGAPVELTADTDLKIKLDAGRFTVVAAEGIELATSARLAMVAGALGVQSPEAQVWIDRLAHVGAEMKAEVQKVKTTFGTLDQALDRWSQRVKRVYRRVEEREQLRAEQIDYVAETTMRMHGHNTVVTADGLVRVDGEQIHLG